MSRIDLQLRPATADATILGSGFVALDKVEGTHWQFAAAGGSCGNVLAILAWLGWSSMPVARLGADSAGQFVCEDLKEFGVQLRHVVLAEKVQTPVVLQRFVEDNAGQRCHRFSLVCPGCGAWLPRFRSVVLSQANEVMAEAAPKAFYFDRVSPAIVKLAEWVGSANGIVFFEPSSVGDEALFRRAVDACHILKYSIERLGHVEDLADARQPLLAVRTCGAKGLQARWHGRCITQSAFTVSQVIDTAGSGDWCSAGLLHVIGQAGANALRKLPKRAIEHGLRTGQALAALNCAYEGARGLMYAVRTVGRVNIMLRNLEGGDPIDENESPVIDWKRTQPDVCQLCSGTPLMTGKRLPQVRANSPKSIL